MDVIKSNPNHNIRYIYESVPGLLSGRHRGVIESKGEIVVYDIRVDKERLSE